MVRSIVYDNDCLESPVLVMVVKVGAQLEQEVPKSFRVVLAKVDCVVEVTTAADTTYYTYLV